MSAGLDQIGTRWSELNVTVEDGIMAHYAQNGSLFLFGEHRASVEKLRNIKSIRVNSLKNPETVQVIKLADTDFADFELGWEQIRVTSPINRSRFHYNGQAREFVLAHWGFGSIDDWEGFLAYWGPWEPSCGLVIVSREG